MIDYIFMIDYMLARRMCVNSRGCYATLQEMWGRSRDIYWYISYYTLSLLLYSIIAPSSPRCRLSIILLSTSIVNRVTPCCDLLLVLFPFRTYETSQEICSQNVRQLSTKHSVVLEQYFPFIWNLFRKEISSLTKYKFDISHCTVFHYP